LWVKRDDCTGLATGGNKTRKLEFLMAEALEQGADTVITAGAVQSNHVRQTTAASARLGLACEVLLVRSVPHRPAAYELTGNVLLDRLFGATLHFLPADAAIEEEVERLAERLLAAGRRPYVIPVGGSNKVGALGYVNCAMELLQQVNDLGLRVDAIVHATGSTGTQAGLVAGLEGCSAGIDVFGISVNRTREQHVDAILRLCQETADYVGLQQPIARERIRVDDAHVGPGYGIPTPGMLEAVTLTARHEGLLLDPVYSGKAMAGLIAMIRDGVFRSGQNIVFVHTGGSVGLFAYPEELGAG
jgi:L-cysteate sulfo-lyase